MAKASVCCFVVGYVPSILYAHYVMNTASGYFIAMYVPHFLMIVVFGYRMYQHSICILNDRPGPWTIHLNTMIKKRTESFSRNGGGGDGGGDGGNGAIQISASDSLLGNAL